MPVKKPLLSLCIPTNGIKEWVIPVVESIYSQGMDNSLFEVVISDNGHNSELETSLSKLSHENLLYFKSDYEGFTNQINCLKSASGLYRKMINHRSCLLPGTLKQMIELVLRYQTIHPVLYFADGKIENESSIIECASYDELLYNLHYWISWSAGIGIWDTDCENLDKITPDKLFPHLSIIFDVRKQAQCVIWNIPYQKMLHDDGKGGYNLFNAFSVSLLSLLSNYVKDEKVSEKAYIKTKQELLGFLSELYFREVILPSRHTFDLSNIKQSICTYYSHSEYFKMIIKAWWGLGKAGCRKIKHTIISKQEN